MNNDYGLMQGRKGDIERQVIAEKRKTTAARHQKEPVQLVFFARPHNEQETLDCIRELDKDISFLAYYLFQKNLYKDYISFRKEHEEEMLRYAKETWQFESRWGI